MRIDAAHVALLLVIINIIGALLNARKTYGDIEKQGRAAVERLAKMELMTQTMWDVLIKGAIVEARQRGAILTQSAAKLDDKIVIQFGEFGAQLRGFYATNNLQSLSDNEVMLILAREFGNELVERVCLPLGLNLATALVLAVHICKTNYNLKELRNAGT